MSFGSMANQSKDYQLPSPPSDGVSDFSFNPAGTMIAAGSWDTGVGFMIQYSAMPSLIAEQ